MMQVHASSCTKNLQNKMADNNANTNDMVAVLTVTAVLANENRKNCKSITVVSTWSLNHHKNGLSWK